MKTASAMTAPVMRRRCSGIFLEIIANRSTSLVWRAPQFEAPDDSVKGPSQAPLAYSSRSRADLRWPHPQETAMSNLNDANPTPPEDVKAKLEKAAEESRQLDSPARTNDSTIDPDKPENEILEGFHGG